MEWIIDNWVLIIVAIAVAVSAVFSVKKFVGLPTDAQIANVKEWLLYAVTLAEKELGAGTGKLKLRYVFDLFATKFPWLVKLVPFETFSEWVDESLEEMRSLLETNTNITKFVSDDK